jgi:hypothetical protein
MAVEEKQEVEPGDDIVDDDKIEDNEHEPDEVNEVDALATEIGWNPDGDLNAKDFILKSKDIQNTMRGHIKDQKNLVSGLTNSVKELKIHNERVYKAENKQLKSELKSLKKEKRTAIEDGDVDKVDEIDEQIDGVKEAISKPEPKTESSNPDFDDWSKENEWYLNDPEMAAYADKIADDNDGAPFKRVATLIGKKVKEMYPDKFETKSTPKPSPVESGTRRIAVAKFTKADLNSGQKTIMRQFVQQGIMTEKQYISDIATTQGV